MDADRDGADGHAVIATAAVPPSAAKLAMARALIIEADQRWQGLARFLEQTGMDENAELIGRLAHRAERRERRRHYIAELRLVRQQQ
jgi:hypothetical protein